MSAIKTKPARITGLVSFLRRTHKETKVRRSESEESLNCSGNFRHSRMSGFAVAVPCVSDEAPGGKAGLHLHIVMRTVRSAGPCTHCAMLSDRMDRNLERALFH